MSPRVAFITGAARGIGESIALRLASESEEISFVLLDLADKEGELKNVVKKLEQKSRKAIYIVADVSVEEQVKNAVEKTVETFGGLDIVSSRCIPYLFYEKANVGDCMRHLTDDCECWYCFVQAIR